MKFSKPTIILFESYVYPDSLDRLEYGLRDAHSRDSDAIVIAIRSPGGYCWRLPEMARLIDRVAQDKPVFAYTDTVMASAAYWLGSCADRIYAAPSAVVGAVGAYSEWLDFAKHFEKEGIEQHLYRAGDDKARIGFDGQMREQDKQEIQAEVNESHSQFKACVKAHRKIEDEFLQGKTFSGVYALECGFIDGFADSLTDFVELLKNGGIE